MDCSPPGSSLHGILQARILEWTAISFSRVSSWPRDQTQVSFTAGRFIIIWAIRKSPSTTWLFASKASMCLATIDFIFPSATAKSAKSLQSVRLCATPEMAAHQVPLSLGFSRQEHWSGLPFPSPMHEREKWKWSRSVVSNSWWPCGLKPTRLLCPWDFPGKSTGVGCHCLLHLSL